MADTKKIFTKLERLSRRISPPVPIGGLHITDFAVRYAGFRGGAYFGESIRLQPGIVENGKIKNGDAFSSVIHELKKRVFPNKNKPVSVVISLPIRDVYIQTFSTPKVVESGFGEAADLNARMISPINVDEAYYGWQRISDGINIDVDTKMLGAFVQKSIADGFVEAVETAGFGIAAVEFESMSLARSINQEKLVNTQKPYVIVQIATEGISIVIVRKGVPHFHYFHSWRDIQGDEKTISIDNFTFTLGDELERVINFYLTHWSGEPLENVIVITPSFTEEISKLTSEKFSNLKIQIVDPSKANAVLGAALRGATPRGEDTEISLASLSALEIFERQQVKNFVRIWRNVFVTSFAFLLALFVGTNIFLRSEVRDIIEERDVLAAHPGMEEFTELSEKAAAFNRLVEAVAQIEAEGVRPSSFLLKLNEIAGAEIELVRVSFDPHDFSVSINGLAPNEASAVAFKNRVSGESNFYDVNLPLQNISTSIEGTSFTLSFKIRSFDFGE